MGIRESLNVLKQVSEVSTLAGINGQVDERRMVFAMGFELDAGRSQVVYVRDSTQREDRKVITVFSPCLVVKKGLFSGFSKEQAMDLLRKNEGMNFARYGIWENKAETMVVASADHLLESLDPQEYKATAYHVAMAADLYERQHGADNF
jgi:ABC-type polar amino acid transport system ATPase subunit